MKTNTTHTTGISNRVCFLGAMLSVVLMMPVAAMSQSSPAPVNLRTAGDFVILSQTGISATGVTQIAGDIGVSPIAATAITGFGLIMDPSGTFSTSSLVVGNVYAADYTTPTPTKMTAAVSDMQTAYTDAAGRLLPDYTELYAGDVTGQTLTPGLYKWSTGVVVSGGAVTISGTATDVWIFQIAGNLNLTSGAMVTLSGGARANNIFWQVAGQTTLGPTAAMKGIILCQTTIVMSTGARLNGRALAQTAATLDANTVTQPPRPTSVSETALPRFSLAQNHPNPFNPTTTIKFQIPNDGHVSLKVFDVLGSEAATLVNEARSAGAYEEVLDAGNLSSGTYFCRLQAGDYVATKKLILLR